MKKNERHGEADKRADDLRELEKARLLVLSGHRLKKLDVRWIEREVNIASSVGPETDCYECGRRYDCYVSVTFDGHFVCPDCASARTGDLARFALQVNNALSILEDLHSADDDLAFAAAAAAADAFGAIGR